MHIVTLVVPCYKRPLRTIRIIDNILAQTLTNWEAFIIGDCCPAFQQLIDSEVMNTYKHKAAQRNNTIIYDNLEKNYGGCGYEIINRAIHNSTGKYFMFASNDDIIDPTHLEHYVSEIEDVKSDMVFFNTFVAPKNEVRIPELREGCIGHAELIINTAILRQMPPHTARYGHDWDVISALIKNNARITKSKTEHFTYRIQHIPSHGTIDTID